MANLSRVISRLRSGTKKEGASDEQKKDDGETWRNRRLVGSRGRRRRLEGRKMERQQESIRRYVRLNERNVNHKKLRAFKSPTRWCTFALITLHLSFLPRPPTPWSSGGGGGKGWRGGGSSSSQCLHGPFEGTGLERVDCISSF